MTEHISVEMLADAAEGLLDPAAQAVVDGHLTGCAACTAEAQALAEVTDLLAGAPAVAMPSAVADRLAAVLVGENARRARHGALHAVGSDETTASGPETSAHPVVPALPYGLPGRPHPQLGRFGADLHRVSAGRRWALPAVAAAVAAALVGFGAYVASATLGLNEPPAVSISVGDGQLGQQAQALQKAKDLQPHRFSQAWWCARSATDGRIVGLASTTVAGDPALLVYTRDDGATEVTLVSGCGTGSPTAGPSAPVGR